MARTATALVCAWMLPGAWAAADDGTRVDRVARTPGLVAFWDFRRVQDDVWISAFDPAVVDRPFPIFLRRIGDPRSYRLGEWPYAEGDGRLVVEEDGPFGRSVRFDRGYVFGEVPRRLFDGGPLDLRGREPFTLMARVKFAGRRHFVAGIWDEGGWDRYEGRRQAALFGGLFGSKGVVAHVSLTGAASYPQSAVRGSQYARIKAMDGRDFADGRWVCMAMTWDPARKEVAAFLDGMLTPRAYADAVIADVFDDRRPQPVNPAAFEGPIFSPRAFAMKFNGYDVRRGGVAEHRLHVDLEGRRVTYVREGPEAAKAAGRFRVRVDVLRDGRSLLPAPLEGAAEPGAEFPLPGSLDARPGDAVTASLFEGAESRVGTELRHVLKEGAPFTFGRALGLGKGEETLPHGSTLFLGGVAVFNRALSAEELAALRFTADAR